MMDKTHIDPRITRTRKLIIDSFLVLSKKKEFNQITVKDITEEAMINRATFYNHFLDKYDLLEKVVAETLKLNLGCDRDKERLSLEETLKSIFLSLTPFNQTIDPHCSSQEETGPIDTIIEIELCRIFSNKLSQSTQSVSPGLVPRLAKLLTTTVITLSKDFLDSTSDETAEECIDSVLPYILYGYSK